MTYRMSDFRPGGDTESSSFRPVRQDIESLRDSFVGASVSQEQWCAVTDKIPCIVYIYDVQAHKHVLVNKYLEHILGYSVALLQNQGMELVLSALHPEDLKRVSAIEKAWQNARDDQVIYHEYQVQNAQGNWVWLSDHAVVLERDNTGAVRLILCINQDITRSKSVEKRLQKNEMFIQSVADVTPNMLYVYDVEKEVNIWANRSFQRYLTQTGTLSGASAGWEHLRNLIHPEDTPILTRRLEKLRKSDSGVIFEVDYRLVIGEQVRIVHDSASVFERNAQGDVSLVLGSALDVTEQRQSAQEKLEMESYLLSAQKQESLSRMAGAIAHNFNNLMMSVTGNLEMLMEDLEGHTDQLDMLRDAQASASRATELSRHMLTYVGQGSAKHEDINLHTLMQSMREPLNLLMQDGVDFQMEVEENLYLPGDESQLRQMITNLVTNAVEALGKKTDGKVWLSCRKQNITEETLEYYETPDGLLPGDYFLLEVRDNGAGMDKHTSQRIFDPFFTTRFTGRGLGLPAALGIARNHGGSMHVESQPGKGSTFQVLLPVTRQAIASVAPDADPTQRRMLLLVDDDDATHKVTEGICRRRGFTVLHANSAEKAYRLLQAPEKRIDCILLDLIMPGTSGEMAYRKIRKIARDVPVVVWSGYGEGEIERRFSKDMPEGFLRKPFRAQQFIAAVEQAIQRKQKKP